MTDFDASEEGAWAPIPWQARFLREVARPEVTTAALSLARSGGKSWLAAKLAADYLLADGPPSECLVVASSYTQAGIIFDYALALARKEGVKPESRAKWVYRDSVNTSLLRSKRTGRGIRCMGSDPRRAHGRKFGLGLMDEPAQWPPAQRDKLLAAFETGLGKVPNAKLIALGTRPASAGHWFSGWLGGGADYVQCHAARKGDPVYQQRTLRRANPSWDYLGAHFRADLIRQRDAARKDPSARARYESLALNLGTSDVLESLLISADSWARVEVDRLPQRSGPLIVGLDLGGTAAMSAAAAYWPVTGRLEALATVAGIPDLRERGRRDDVGGLYIAMAKAGELLVQPGVRVPSYRRFLREIRRRWGRPRAICADRYREAELRDALDGVLPGSVQLVLRGQGWRDGGEDVRRFERAVLEERVKVRKSLLIRSSLSESRTVTDPGGSTKLAVGAQGGRRAAGRDDVSAAIILALAEADRRWPQGIVRRQRVRLHLVG